MTRYPLTKMDMVSQTDQPGAAMEVKFLDNLVTISLLLPQNWGLMIFDTPALLIDPSSTNDNDRQEEFILLSKINLSRFWVLNVVAHELAHQWFGNIVTLDW